MLHHRIPRKCDSFRFPSEEWGMGMLLGNAFDTRRATFIKKGKWEREKTDNLKKQKPKRRQEL